MPTKAKTGKKKAVVSKRKVAPKKTYKWSDKVTATSDVMDLKANVFKSDDPKKIALSLKLSANKSHRRKGTPFQSAMSMLNFYINRAGNNLPEAQLKVLGKAKDELRALFGREKT